MEAGASKALVPKPELGTSGEGSRFVGWIKRSESTNTELASSHDAVDSLRLNPPYILSDPDLIIGNTAMQSIAETQSMRNRSSHFAEHILTLTLLLSNVAFFYLYMVSLKGVLYSLCYFVLVILIPGWFLALLFFITFRKDDNDRPTWDLMLPLLTVMGIANLVVSYFLAQVTGARVLIYTFAWAYSLVFFHPVRKQLKSLISGFVSSGYALNSRRWPIVLLFILCLNVIFFSLRPTPGILPLDIYPDKLWDAGNTVAMTLGFPLQSMNIETRPYISYHILYYIMAAHMVLTTGLVPHLVSLQYIFIPLIPWLVLCMTALMHQFFKKDNLYLFYGLALLLFGGGFHMVHEVKAQNLNSSTNFIGVLLLFAVMTIILHSAGFKKTGRGIALFAGVFLATVAKGSIGACLVAGIVLWACLQIWRKSLSTADIADSAAAVLGFLSSYALFFVMPSLNADTSSSTGQAGFPFVPLTYVTKNELFSPLVDLLYKLLPGVLPIFTHVLFTILVLPLYILLYYSYRLVVVYDYKIHGGTEKIERVLLVVLGSLTMGYLVNMGSWQNHAYMITSAVFMLDVLFIAYAQKEKLFARIPEFWGRRNIFACLGACMIVILPFITMPGWIRAEHTHNLLMFSKMGKLLDFQLRNTTYRKERRIITPELYETLQFMRTSAEGDAIVVTPILELPDGRPTAFYTSAFSERTAYVEGFYGGQDVTLHLDRKEIDQRQALVKKIYGEFIIPDQLQNSKYLFLATVETSDAFAKRYATEILFKNAQWCVVRINQKAPKVD